MQRLYCKMPAVLVYAVLEPCLLMFMKQLSGNYINGSPC